MLSLPHVTYYVLWENGDPHLTNEAEVYDFYASERAGKMEDKKGEDQKKEIKIPLGAILVQSLINLLFKQNYTISVLDAEEKAHIDPYGIDIKLIWRGGLQFSETKQHKETKYDANRIEVLKLLLLCASSQLYNPADSKVFNFSVFYATCGAAPFVKNMFFSLLNVVLSHQWQGFVSMRTSYLGNSLCECQAG